MYLEFVCNLYIFDCMECQTIMNCLVWGVLNMPIAYWCSSGLRAFGLERGENWAMEREKQEEREGRREVEGKANGCLPRPSGLCPPLREKNRERYREGRSQRRGRQQGGHQRAAEVPEQ